MCLKKGCILKPKINRGYLRIGLWKNNKQPKYYVHCLVAQAFLPNTDNLPEINHKNECKWDNAVWNLEWCTRDYNCKYGTSGERISQNKKGKFNTPISKPVLQFTLDGQFIAEYPSVKEAQRQTGINNSNISQCCRGNKNYTQCGGFKWNYK